MQRPSKIASNSGFIPAEDCGLQDDGILLCLASSTTPRRRNLLVALAQYSVTHFRSSSTKPSSWFLSSLFICYLCTNIQFLQKKTNTFIFYLKGM